jgi:hypothetical protein
VEAMGLEPTSLLNADDEVRRSGAICGQCLGRPALACVRVGGSLLITQPAQ